MDNFSFFFSYSIVGKFEEGGWWINSHDESETDVFWIISDVELILFLYSLNDLSGSETTGWKGDKGFPLVPILFEATVIIADFQWECSLQDFLFCSPSKIRLKSAQGRSTFISPFPNNDTRRCYHWSLHLE